MTFDIDANGIVNVPAKDLGTGKEQKITITASSGLSKDEVDKMMREAESHADEDKKRREEIETRNRADQAVYAAERMLKDAGDKLSSDRSRGGRVGDRGAQEGERRHRRRGDQRGDGGAEQGAARGGRKPVQAGADAGGGGGARWRCAEAARRRRSRPAKSRATSSTLKWWTRNRVRDLGLGSTVSPEPNP